MRYPWKNCPVRGKLQHLFSHKADEGYRVRSREGRRNRAPPPRIRYNKDGKKVNPTQGAKVAQA